MDGVEAKMFASLAGNCVVQSQFVPLSLLSLAHTSTNISFLNLLSNAEKKVGKSEIFPITVRPGYKDHC